MSQRKDPRNVRLKRAGQLTGTGAGTGTESEIASRKLDDNQYSAYSYYSIKIQNTVRRDLGESSSIHDIATEIENRWTNVLSQQERKEWEEVASTKMSSSRSNYSYRALDTSSDTLQSALLDQRKQVKNQIEYGASKKKIRVQSDHNVDEQSVQDGFRVETEKPMEDDHARPKRPMTAYMFFTKEARAKIKVECPNMTGSMVTSALGKRWAGMCEEEKSKYKKLELEARKEYGELMKKWKLKNKSKTVFHRIATIKKPSTGSSHNYSIYCASTRTPSSSHNNSSGAHSNGVPTVASTYCSSTTTGSINDSESFVPSVMGEYSTFKSGDFLPYSYPRMLGGTRRFS